MDDTGDTEGSLYEIKEGKKGRPGRKGDVRGDHHKQNCQWVAGDGDSEKRKKQQAMNATQRL